MYIVEVEWMDGRQKTFEDVVSAEDESCITIYVPHKSPGSGRKVVSIIPLHNVREVRFP